MISKKVRKLSRARRQAGIRAKISGTAKVPRVAVFRSNRHLYLQAIDDTNKNTIAASSDLKSKDLASELAKKLIDKKIKKIVFDRGGFKYHGQIKNIADNLRKAGLEF